MLFDDKRRALRRALAGALLGMAGGGLAAWAAGSLIAGSPSALALAFLNCGFPRGLEGVGIALSFALYALFGAEVGVATLPFAGDGSALVGRTLAHFALTAATVGLWVGLNFGVRETAAFLVPLALVYLLVWLGRWVGWYAEVSAIRERLGLAPGPTGVLVHRAHGDSVQVVFARGRRVEAAERVQQRRFSRSSFRSSSSPPSKSYCSTCSAIRSSQRICSPTC